MSGQRDQQRATQPWNRASLTYCRASKEGLSRAGEEWSGGGTEKKVEVWSL